MHTYIYSQNVADKGTKSKRLGNFTHRSYQIAHRNSFGPKTTILQSSFISRKFSLTFSFTLIYTVDRCGHIAACLRSKRSMNGKNFGKGQQWPCISSRSIQQKLKFNCINAMRGLRFPYTNLVPLAHNNVKLTRKINFSVMCTKALVTINEVRKSHVRS